MKVMRMKNFVARSIATVAVMATLSLGTPLAAFAGTTSPSTVSSQSASPQHNYQIAVRHYLYELKVINHTFIAAIKTARANYFLAVSAATNSTERISARASYKLAIVEATVARAKALVALGHHPIKPHAGSL